MTRKRGNSDGSKEREKQGCLQARGLSERIGTSAVAVCKVQGGGSCRASGGTLDADRFRAELGWI
jgi:hypothetical protein